MSVSVYDWSWVRPLRKALLWLALGPRTFRYMAETVRWDRRTRTARMVDIVVRKDGHERRMEADWVKTIARILDARGTVVPGTPQHEPVGLRVGADGRIGPP